MPDDTRRLKIEEAIEHLGGVVEEFRPDWRNVLASGIIGPSLILVGLTILYFWSVHPAAWETALLIVGGCGLLFCFSGTWGCIRCYRISGYRVLFCANGLIVARQKTIQTMPFAEITKIEHKIMTDPRRQLTAARERWVIHSKVLRPITFDLQSLGNMKQFASLLHAASVTHGIMWEEQQTWSG
jgi:hypothetical protein